MTDESPSPSKIIPNTFQTPNAFTDEIMAFLTGNETKCYMVIVRKTMGWNKKSDNIAKAQIMSITGLGEDAVEECMASLVQFGLVLRLSENNPKKNYGVEWSLQMDDKAIQWSQLEQRASLRKGKKVAAALAPAKGGGEKAPLPDFPPLGGGELPSKQKPLSKAIYDDIGGTVFKFYENEIGLITPVIREKINVWLDDDKFPAQWIIDAIRLAVVQNARNWAYVETILSNWKNKGKSAPKPKGVKPNANNKSDKPVFEDNASKLAEINKRRKSKQ